MLLDFSIRPLLQKLLTAAGVGVLIIYPLHFTGLVLMNTNYT
jgi:hypothetical protein